MSDLTASIMVLLQVADEAAMRGAENTARELRAIAADFARWEPVISAAQALAAAHPFWANNPKDAANMAEVLMHGKGGAEQLALLRLVLTVVRAQRGQ